MDELEVPPGGGSFLLAWQLRNRRVLVVGGGDVSSGRIKSALAADAYITLISPYDGLHHLTKFLIKHSDRITYIDRVFSGPKDLAGVDMVLTAIDDVEESRRICALCRERQIPVNVADIPPSCDFYFGAHVRKGPLQILISTNGKAPKLANLIKSRIEESLPPNIDRAINNVGNLRARLRRKAPGVGGDLSRERMQWMTSFCSSWDLGELANLDDAQINEILAESWERRVVPKPPRKRTFLRSKGLYRLDTIIALIIGFLCGLAFSYAFISAR